jgi:thermopsin
VPLRLKVFVLLFLIVAPAVLLAAPIAQIRAQGQTEQRFSGVTPPDSYNYTQITVASTSIVGYATKSDIQVETAFMTYAQLQSFSLTGDISNSIFYDTGTENYDALLEPAGQYYLVVYNPNTQTANLNALYIVNPDINLSNSTTSVGLTIVMQPQELFTIPLHVETLGAPSQVDITGASSQIVRYALLDNTTQQNVFESTDVTITNFTVVPKVSLGYNLSLNPGFYIMAIKNDSPDPALVYFSYTIKPEFVNPYLLHFGSPSPTGIASYGILNSSGNITPYEVATSSIVGFAKVSQLQAVDNGTNSPLASLQENTVLQVNNTDGSSYTYWPQNVLAFNTASPATVTYRDNVLNVTGDNAQLTNQSITGTGTTSGYNNNGIQQTYYGNYNSNYTYRYSLPQTWILYTNETVQQGKGVLINLGVRALNGPTPDKVTWFDAITIHDPGVSSADLIVNGRDYTPAGVELPIGTYYDAELVFGGGAGGNAARFQVNANLALFYLDGTMKPFPSVYSFGDDTAEAAFNINMQYGNGVATATTGTPYYGLLTNDFNSSLPALIAGAGSGSSGLGGLTDYIIGAAVIAVIVILILAIVLRRRSAPSALAEQPAPIPMQPATAFCGNCGTPLDAMAQFCPNCGAPQVHDDTGQPPNPGP